MKTCSKCGESKPVECFSKGSGRHKDGLHPWCRECAKKYKQDRKGHYAALSLSDYYRNADSRKAGMRRNKRTPAGRVQNLYDGAKARAKRDGVAFSLTKEWIAEQLRNPCALTGRAFSFDPPVPGRHHNPNAPSLDRIDPDGAYTPDNVQAVVVHANLAKHQFGNDALFELVRDIMRTISSRASSKEVEGSTTISKESRAKRPEARGASEQGAMI